jgi:hypothetical protein
LWDYRNNGVLRAVQARVLRRYAWLATPTMHDAPPAVLHPCAAPAIRLARAVRAPAAIPPAHLPKLLLAVPGDGRGPREDGQDVLWRFCEVLAERSRGAEPRVRLVHLCQADMKGMEMRDWILWQADACDGPIPCIAEWTQTTHHDDRLVERQRLARLQLHKGPCEDALPGEERGSMSARRQ